MKGKIFFKLILVAVLFWAIFSAAGVYAFPEELPEPDIFGDKKVWFVPNVRIPGTDFDGLVPVKADGALIGRYVVAIYTYGAGFAGIVAMFMLVLAGWKWLMAAGNSQKITSAKEMINGVLVGLALLFGGQLLLSQISKDLVVFQELSLPAITSIKEDAAQCQDGFAKRAEEGIYSYCGSSFVTTSAVYTGREITCIDTRCPEDQICVSTKGKGLCPDSVPYISSNVQCGCVSSLCSDMYFGPNDWPLACGYYITPEFCEQNYCFGQATKEDSDPMSAVCILKDDNKCKPLSEQTCDTTADCILANNPDTRGWCCEDVPGILGRDKCSPIGGPDGIDSEKCKN
ncbi:pilin [Patescibacteria group bacterium]|nr:pilin [Patescibacteria group bacterium]